WSERSRWRSETPARAAAAAAIASTTSRGTATTLPSRPTWIVSSMPIYAPALEPCNLLTRTERVHLSPPHEVQTLTVGHDRGEGAVGVRPDLLPGARVERVRAPLERGEVDDAV